MYALAQNFRFAFRQLCKTPGFALTAVLVLVKSFLFNVSPTDPIIYLAAA